MVQVWYKTMSVIMQCDVGLTERQTGFLASLL